MGYGEMNNNKPKVLMATMSLGIGGAETHIIELALELRRRGFDVSVASNGGVYVADIENAGITHFCVPMHRRSPSSMLRSYFMMRKIIKREKPDIVHAHARIPGFICGLVKKKRRFGFVTTAHWVFDAGGSLRYLTNWGEKTIAVSEDIKQYLIDNYSISPDDIFVTINGINTDRFKPEKAATGILSEFGLDAARPIVCNVSRLDENAAAATRTLIEIAPQLHERIPGVQLLIVGDGDIYDELHTKAQAVNAQTGTNTITLAGARTDVYNILAVCDLFVGVSRTALEAMAAAKPVIAAGKEGFAGLITPDKTQIAVDTNFTFRGCEETTEEALLNSISGFFEKSTLEERAKLGEFGRMMVEKDYSVSKMADDCIKAYDAVMRTHKNVVMSGYYGFKNAGDEAILQSIYRSIKESCDDISITVLSYDPQDTNSRYGYTAVNRFNIFRVFRTLRRCDLLVSGGGSLLQDFTSTRSLLYYLYIIRTAKRMGKKVMIYANGIGPVSKKANRRRVCRIAGRADVITLRDSDSAQELRAMGVSRDDIKVTADPVFTMSGISRDEALGILKECGVTDSPYIAVSIREWPNMGKFSEKIAFICDSVYEATGRSVLFIPMQPDKETGISRKIQGMMKNPSHILEGRFTAEELMGIIGVCDIMLAMRLHALIFAACMNVPFAGLVYDPKVSAYLDALSMPSAGDVTDFDENIALEAVMGLIERRDVYAEELKIKTAQLREASKEDPALLLELLTGTNT